MVDLKRPILLSLAIIVLAVSQSAPADPAPTLVLAVGLEKIVPGYNGPAIRIRRPSDNKETDIGFAAGSKALDSAAVSTFLGNQQGWITTLYAQDGGGHNVMAPANTDNMPTISAVAPTAMILDRVKFLTARNVKQGFGPNGDGNPRYFNLPAAVSIDKAQASAFLALRLDTPNAYSGAPMSLYEVGDPTKDAFDLMTNSGGLQGLTRKAAVLFPNTNHIIPRVQPSVIGLVTSPSAPPIAYLDGVAHVLNSGPAPSGIVSGGHLMAGDGTRLFYGISLWATYDFLGFALYRGSVPPDQAAAISHAMVPRGPLPRYHILADGDSITQGTGDLYGHNTLRYLEPQLNQPADIENVAVYGTVSGSAVGTNSNPTAATSTGALCFRPNAARNIYYVDIGTNDIHNGISDAQKTWANVQQALKNAKANGYTTIATTLMHEHGEKPEAAAQIDRFNTLIRAAVGSPYLDGLIDYAADPRLSPPNYFPKYAVDGAHPNDAGYQVMAGLAAPVFNKFIPSTK